MKKAKKRISAQESRGALFDSISGRNPAIKESNSDLEEDFIRINLQNREFFLISLVVMIKRVEYVREKCYSIKK